MRGTLIYSLFPHQVNVVVVVPIDNIPQRVATNDTPSERNDVQTATVPSSVPTPNFVTSGGTHTIQDGRWRIEDGLDALPNNLRGLTKRPDIILPDRTTLRPVLIPPSAGIKIPRVDLIPTGGQDASNLRKGYTRKTGELLGVHLRNG
jgi:hypothetical protein